MEQQIIRLSWTEGNNKLTNLWTFFLVSKSSKLMLKSPAKNLQGRIQKFWKGGTALRISDEGDPTMAGGDVEENFEN